MSIIAEALQRLQKQTPREESAAPDNPSLVIPPRGRREPGWHTPPSRVKFCLAGMAMAILFSSLGLFAYWIGFNLEFGLSTFASSGTNQPMVTSDSTLITKTSSVDSQMTESMQRSSSTSDQDVTTSASQQPEEALSTIQPGVPSETPEPKEMDNSLPSLNVVESLVSPITETRSLSPTTPQAQTTTSSPPGRTLPNDAKFSPASRNPDLTMDSPGLPVISSAQPSDSATKLVKSDVFDVTEIQAPMEVVLEEQHVEKEDFSKLSRQVIDDTPFPTDATALIPKKEERPRTVQEPVSEQLSPTARFRQAQQFIQVGKYKEAAVLLSPLFKDPPVNWEPWFWMGTALLGQDQLEQADQFFLSGLARNDKIPQLWIQRALVAHQRGDYQLAIHELRRAESLDSDLPHTHLNMGYAYEKLGNDRLANEYYARFLKLSEGNPDFFSIRKKLYARFTEQVTSTPKPGLPSSLPENP